MPEIYNIDLSTSIISIIVNKVNQSYLGMTESSTISSLYDCVNGVYCFKIRNHIKLSSRLYSCIGLKKNNFKVSFWNVDRQDRKFILSNWYIDRFEDS